MLQLSSSLVKVLSCDGKHFAVFYIISSERSVYEKTFFPEWFTGEILSSQPGNFNGPRPLKSTQRHGPYWGLVICNMGS